MTRRTELAAFGTASLLLASCAPLTDQVFTALSLTSSSPLVVDEGSGVVEFPLRLAQAPVHGLSLAYRLVGIDAQDDCQNPDFGAADGRVEWPPGAQEARVRVWIGDDELAERDERLELRFVAADGAAAAPLAPLQIVIADDERSALLDAGELGVRPGVADDQSAALQAVLESAAERGRAVVVMAPGDYEISSVTLPPGITLSARDVRWHRPAMSPEDTVSLRMGYEGAEPSPPSLVEGLAIDGRREEQGPYRAHEREAAHLLELAGDADQGGALRATFERVTLVSGTGSGLFIGPNADVTVCGLSASELWRDALTLNGGATELRVVDLDATATQGTGLWLGARVPGFGGSYRIGVEAQDVKVGAGDVELEVSDSSQVTLRRLTMTQAPFRLDAPGGSVRIEDSVLVLGTPTTRDHWSVAHDVQIARTTVIASETDTSTSEEAPRASSAIVLTSQSFALGAGSPGPGRLGFSDCRFELARNVAPDEVVYALQNSDANTSVVVTSSELGAGLADWFAPECSGCALAP
jgi:hypothetical protein